MGVLPGALFPLPRIRFLPCRFLNMYLRKVLGEFEDTMNSPSRVTPETHSHILGAHQCIVLRGKQHPAFYCQSQMSQMLDFFFPLTPDTYRTVSSLRFANLLYYLRLWIQILLHGSIISTAGYIYLISPCSVYLTLVDFWYVQPRLNTNTGTGLPARDPQEVPTKEFGYPA